MHFLFISEIIRGSLAKQQSGRVEFGNIIYRFARRNSWYFFQDFISRFAFPFFFSKKKKTWSTLKILVYNICVRNKPEYAAFSVEKKKIQSCNNSENQPEKKVPLSLSTSHHWREWDLYRIHMIIKQLLDFLKIKKKTFSILSNDGFQNNFPCSISKFIKRVVGRII